MKPTIALVGRPNVGKSTLFNKLTRTQDALVADLPGLTRDRQYGDGKVGGWPYLLVDTGGLSGAPDSLDAAMADQTLSAVREADLVVFMVDGRAGIVAVDEEIADVLRRQARHVVLCVNKIDGIGEDKAQLDFHQLGFETMVPIAASHNRGVQQLVEELADFFQIPQEDRFEPSRKRHSRRKKDRENATELDSYGVPFEVESEGDSGAGAGGTATADGSAGDSASRHAEEKFGPGYEPAAPDEVRITFVGRPNVGKSTLINRLLGEDRVIAYDQPGTTRDSVAIPFERAGKEYTLIDTAGVRRRGKVSEKVEIFSIIKTLQSIDKSNVCVMLLDGTDGITEQDLSLLGYIIDKGRALIVAVNKWDSLDEQQRLDMREELERRVEFLKFTRIHFISALQGSGVGDLFKSINRAYSSAFVDLSTPKLTRMLEVVIAQHQPPMVNGRRIKLRYAHQGGQNPPIIVIHGKQALKVPQSYQRYLMNHFTKALKLFGTPLRIEFRQDDNPYEETGRVKSAPGKEDLKHLKEKRAQERKAEKVGGRGGVSKDARGGKSGSQDSDKGAGRAGKKARGRKTAGRKNADRKGADRKGAGRDVADKSVSSKKVARKKSAARRAPKSGGRD